MKINRPSPVNFGILNRHIVRRFPTLGYIDIFKGETSKSLIEIYKEHTLDKLDLKFYLIKNKFTGKIRSRIQHLSDNKVVKEVNRGIL